MSALQDRILRLRREVEELDEVVENIIVVDKQSSSLYSYFSNKRVDLIKEISRLEKVAELMYRRVE